MKTRNEILLEKLKKKYPNLKTDKPTYPEDYWDIIKFNKKLSDNKFKPESWVIGSLLPNFRKFLLEEYSKTILDLIYKSLSHEIYSQLYQYYFYKKDGIDYGNIDEIISELNNFQVKKELDVRELSELENLKKFIVKGLMMNDNLKYKSDVINSFWNLEDIDDFLFELGKYFKEKSNLLKSKKDKIDRELDFERGIEESLNRWISLPTNFDQMVVDHHQIIDSIIIDVFES